MIRSACRLLVLLALLSGCWHRTPDPPIPSAFQAAIDRRDALAIADALEALIAEGKDTQQERQLAYDRIREKEEASAQYAFARATVAGRLVQLKGLTAALLVREMESYALRSRELDPAFRNGAATRALGTLYVLAPATLLAHGDSEKGLELLEQVARDYPGVIENHLRYAEGLIALGDPGPATASLCRCLAKKSSLRKDEQTLLDKLFQDAGSPSCPPP